VERARALAPEAELSETEYVSQTLSRCATGRAANSVHVWIVAHPQKMRRETGSCRFRGPDMIAGSSHWWNKADNAITVWRDFDEARRSPM
jgi:twinkle protein